MIVSTSYTTAGIVSLLVGTVLPILVGFITTKTLNPGLKSGILAAVSALSGGLAQWLTALTNNVHFVWQAAVLSAVATWLVAEATYFKWWKPSGISDVVQALGVTSTPQPVVSPVDNLDPPANPPADGGKWKGPEHLRQ